MTQIKGFTIFARASLVTSPYKTFNTPIRALSPPMSEDEGSIDASHTDPDTGKSSAASSTTSISSTCSDNSKPASRPKVDFFRLETIFSRAEAAESSSSSSSLWYILTTALLLAFHKERLVGGLWNHLSDSTMSTGQIDEDLLATARRIREACLKASTLVGFPRAINALLTLQQAISSTHPHLSTTLSQDSSLRFTPSLTPSQKYDRGMSLFSRIYDKHTPRVISTMSSCSGGDLTHFAINSIYGELLAESSIIGDVETGVLEFVCCLADGVAPQAKGHFFGSVNLGASEGVLRGAVELSEVVARMVGVPCAWKGEGEDGEEDAVDEWKFLNRVMQ